MNHHIHPIPALKDNYIWLFANLDNQKAWIVDPGEVTPVIDYLHAHLLNLEAILITHHHGDHTNGAAELRERYQVPVYGSIDNQHPAITHRLHHGDSLALPALGLSFQAIAVPGHTLDHMAFYSPPYVLTGDTLFSAGCGRMFEGTPPQMYASLQRLLALPDDTQIFCGHEYTLSNLVFANQVEPNNPAIIQHQQHVARLRAEGSPSLPSTIALEKQINLFLRATEPEVIQAASVYAGQIFKEPWQVFATLREWKNSI